MELQILWNNEIPNYDKTSSSKEFCGTSVAKGFQLFILWRANFIQMLFYSHVMQYYKSLLFICKPFVINRRRIAIWTLHFLYIFFNLNDISTGSSHSSIQSGARPLTGDLPTTAPLPLTFEF